MLDVKVYISGAMKTNCCLVTDVDTGESAIIDPASFIERLDKDISELKSGAVKYILLTHGHFDHIGRADRYRKITGAKIAIGVHEAKFTVDNSLNLSIGKFLKKGIKSFEADILLNDNDELKLGGTTFKVIHTPGHTAGGVCYISENVIFSGDTLMKNDIGRSDLITGDSNELMKSIERISHINGNYIIYPGHGEITTLDNEKQNNPYFRKVKDENIY